MDDKYLHSTNNGTDVSLHDCVVSGIRWETGKLTLSFKDGIYLLPSSGREPTRTGAAQAEYLLPAIGKDDITVHIFTPKRNGMAIREEWDVSRLSALISYGKCRLEFLYTFRSGWTWLLRLSLLSDRRPYIRECELELPVEKTSFSWKD